MRTNVLLLFLLAAIYSCNNKDTRSRGPLPIKLLAETAISPEGHGLFGEAEYITLETTEQCLLGNIDKLIPYNGFLYILDKAQAKKIFVYSENGDFIRTIGEIGSGPGEYSNIEDFTIDETTNNVVALSYPSQITIYSADGQFINQQKLTSSALLWNICSYENGYICSSNHQTVLSGEEAFLIFNYDKDFQLQSKILQVLPTHIPIPPFISNPLLINGDNISYFDVFTNIVHHNVNTPDYQSVRFDFEGKEVPFNIYASPQEFFINQKDYAFFIDGIVADNLLIVSFAFNGERYVSVIDASTNKTKTYESTTWFPDRLLFFRENTFYSSASPLTVLENKSTDFKKALANHPLNMNSNPVVLRFRLKSGS